MWSSERFRGYTYQFLLVAALVAIVGYAAFNLITNLHSRAITVGFSYLSQEAGFDIAERLIDYEPSDSYGRAFVVGLLNTLLVSFLGVIAATLGGLLIGIGRLSSNWVVRKFATWYVECVRNVPLILQLLLWYGMLTELLPPVASALGWKSVFLSQRGMTMPWPEEPAGLYGLLYGILAAAILLLCMHGWKKRQNRLGAECGNWLTKHSLGLSLVILILIPALGVFASGTDFALSYPALGSFDFEGGRTIAPEFIALLVGLSVYTSAFIAEIVRGGIMAVPKGQVDAAQALGLSWGRRLRLVVLPQAMRVMIPPLTSQYLNLTKNSSLAVAIGYPDLVSVSNTTLNQTGQAIEAIAMMMAVYLILSLAISAAMNWYNYSVRLVER